MSQVWGDDGGGTGEKAGRAHCWLLFWQLGWFSLSVSSSKWWRAGLLYTSLLGVGLKMRWCFAHVDLTIKSLCWNWRLSGENTRSPWWPITALMVRSSQWDLESIFSHLLILYQGADILKVPYERICRKHSNYRLTKNVKWMWRNNSFDSDDSCVLCCRDIWWV